MIELDVNNLEALLAIKKEQALNLENLLVTKIKKNKKTDSLLKTIINTNVKKLFRFIKPTRKYFSQNFIDNKETDLAKTLTSIAIFPVELLCNAVQLPFFCLYGIGSLLAWPFAKLVSLVQKISIKKNNNVLDKKLVELEEIEHKIQLKNSSLTKVENREKLKNEYNDVKIQNEKEPTVPTLPGHNQTM